DEERKLKDILLSFRARKIDIVSAKLFENNRYQKIVRQILQGLEDQHPVVFDNILRETIEAYNSVDALYIVDDDGIQITETFIKKDSKHLINPLFRAVSKNESLSYKEYFYQLINTDLQKYTTDRYISFATGNLCITLSHLFTGNDNRRYILCTDFLVNN
ncbi:MAG: hypothetical protein ABFD66_12140, partial [Smithella sp.]